MAKAPIAIEKPVPEPETMSPQTNEEYLERGWLYFSKQKYELAEADIQLVLQSDPHNVDALYVLGLTLKAAGKSQQAMDAFTKIDEMISYVDDHQRAIIISRLAHGQVNQIRSGNWDLEKEIWKSIH